MEPTRRQILASLTALAGLAACDGEVVDEPPEPAPDRPPEPAPWQPSGSQDATAFAWPVIATDALATGVLLSVRTTEPEVVLTVVGAVEDAWEEVASHPGLAPEEGTVQLAIDDLDPDRAYTVVAHTPDGARRSAPTRFRTATDDAGFRKVVIGATSCLGTKNPDQGSLARLAELNLDVMLLLGDTIYASSTTLEQYRQEWGDRLSLPAFAAMARSTSLVATWDDHEIANNWVLGETIDEARLQAGTQAFAEALPWRPGPTGGLWRAVRWGTVVELFVLDCRGERDHADHIVSDAQLAWLITELAASPAVFKVVVASVHVTDHTDLFSIIEANDRWQGYPEQRDALVATLEAVPGVLVITGDMHYGALQHLGPPGEPGDTLWEVAAGPAGSEIVPVDEIATLTGATAEQYPVLLTAWTSCVITLDPALGKAEVRFVDDDGAELARRTLGLVS